MSSDDKMSNINSSDNSYIGKILKNGLSIDALKYIAIIAMLIDHIGNAFVEEPAFLANIMYMIGRITGPVMFFAAVEGYHKTKNLRKYMLRLFTFALISYLPYIFAFRSSFNALRLNVLFTILIGVLAVCARRNIKNIFLKVLAVILLLIASIPTDYGTSGVLIILVFDYYYGNRKNQVFGYMIIAMLEFSMLHLITSPFWSLVYENNFDLSSIQNNYSELGYIIPAFLLYTYNGKRGKNAKFSKWLFYIFYPLHLTVIAVIRIFLA